MTELDRVAQLIERHRGRALSIGGEIAKLRAMAEAARTMAQETRAGAQAYHASGEMVAHARALLERTGSEPDECAVRTIVLALSEQAIQISMHLAARANEFEEAATRLEGERAALLATVGQLEEASL